MTDEIHSFVRLASYSSLLAYLYVKAPCFQDGAHLSKKAYYQPHTEGGQMVNQRQKETAAISITP